MTRTKKPPTEVINVPVTVIRDRKKTMAFSELQRLAFCNSKKLPRFVWLEDTLVMWTGIGFIPVDPTEEELDGSEPTIVDD